MVLTPVGYKCKECARPAKGQYTYVKPRQLAIAALWAMAAGLLGGLILAILPIGFFFIHLLFGAAVGEAARRGSGGHRSAPIAVIAALGAFAGALIGFDLLGMLLAPAAAAIYVLGNRW